MAAASRASKYRASRRIVTGSKSSGRTRSRRPGRPPPAPAPAGGRTWPCRSRAAPPSPCNPAPRAAAGPPPGRPAWPGTAASGSACAPAAARPPAARTADPDDRRRRARGSSVCAASSRKERPPPGWARTTTVLTKTADQPFELRQGTVGDRRAGQHLVLPRGAVEEGAEAREQGHEEGRALTPGEFLQPCHRAGERRAATRPPRWRCTAGRGRSAGSSSTGRLPPSRRRQYASCPSQARPRGTPAASARSRRTGPGARGEPVPRRPRARWRERCRERSARGPGCRSTSRPAGCDAARHELLLAAALAHEQGAQRRAGEVEGAHGGAPGDGLGLGLPRARPAGRGDRPRQIAGRAAWIDLHGPSVAGANAVRSTSWRRTISVQGARPARRRRGTLHAQADGMW